MKCTRYINKLFGATKNAQLNQTINNNKKLENKLSEIDNFL